jgi:hypothetical protein
MLHATIWGEYYWYFLHYVTKEYPDKPLPEDKEAVRKVFYSLRHTIPCSICKKHYTEKLRSMPVEKYYNSKKDLIKMYFTIHNQVNHELKKKQYQFKRFEKDYKTINFFKFFKMLEFNINTYNPEKHNHYLDFYNGLAIIIPHSEIKEKYNKLLEEFPINKDVINNKKTIVSWHNNVIKPLINEYMYKNIEVSISYIISNGKLAMGKILKINKSITNPYNYLDLKLGDVIFYDDSTYIELLLKNGDKIDKIDKILLDKQIIKNNKYFKYKLITFEEDKLQKVYKSVPKRFRK